MLVIGAFDDAGMQHLAKVTTLKEVTLDSPQVTDASMEVLSGLKNLRKLQLAGTKITEAGRKRLRQLLPKVVVTP